MKSDWKEFEMVQRLEVVKNLASGKSVLHLGCTNYPYTQESIEADMLLHDRLGEVASELYGFDSDLRGIEVLRAHGADNLFTADLEALDAVDLEKTFDVIIAGEMIEHLSNPGLFLTGIQRFMNDQTVLLITTVNAYCAFRFAIYGLRGKLGRNEPVHPDHVAYYSYRTLSLLIRRSGLNQKRFLFYDIGHEHRATNRWYWNFVNDLAVRISPHLSDGVIAICGLKDEPDE